MGENARASAPPVTPQCVAGLVWRLLQHAPQNAPSVVQIAALYRRPTRRLRREWQALYGGRSCGLRDVIARAKLEFAWRQIRRGDKCLGSSRTAGYKSYWHFNRQTKRYAGCTAQQIRHSSFSFFDEYEVAAALSRFDEGMK